MTTRTTSTSSGKISPFRATMLGAATVIASLGAVGTAQAKDAVATTIVNPDGGGFPVLVTENGSGMTPGTYAIGTIMVDYFVTGFQFPTNWQGSFRMCLDSRAAARMCPRTRPTPRKWKGSYHVDELLRKEHEEDYCGIVYADDLEKPAFIKIYDPHNLGVSCGSSGQHIFPGWTMSLQSPVNLKPAVVPNNRKRWWSNLCGS